MTREFDIFGMTCASCQQNIQKTISKIKGVQAVTVNLVSNTMVVESDDKVSANEIIKKVVSIGYNATERGTQTSTATDDNHEITANHELKRQKINLIISVILLLPLLYIAMGPMIGLPNLPILDGTANALMATFAQCLLTAVILIINKHFFQRGLKALVKRVPNMDSLVALGAGAAFVYGVIVIFIMAYGFGHGDLALVHQYHHALYFEGAATIVTLVSLGKYFENKAKVKTSSEISKLMKLAPKTCTVMRNGVPQSIAVSELIVGDEILIKPGEVVPVDGEIVSGNGLLDQSAITGESVPVSKTVGENVISATINQNGTFTFRATKVGKDTTLAQIIALVEKASNSKAPIAKIADRVSGVFVPVVITIALLTLLVWSLVSRDFAQAFNFAISVLVISCPCALGLATPLAIMVATGKAAEYGILIKDAENLENLGRIDTVVLDKTGTITTGTLTVTDVVPLQAGLSANELIKICASVERFSNHPLAKAIVTHAPQQYYQIQNFTEMAGKGTQATLHGKTILIGNPKLVNASLTKAAQAKVQTLTQDLAQAGKTPLICLADHDLLGVIALADTIRENSVAAVKKLQDMGLTVIMLTGDNQITAQAFGKQVGITQVVANVLPEQKYAQIELLKQQGHRVLMVGDGINDSPALKAAHIGVAIGSGTDIAMQSAGVVLIKNSLHDLVTIINLSKRTIANIKLSLFWAFFYNTLGIPLAAGVFYPLLHTGLNPMIASLAMSLSSLCVVLNALTLRCFKSNGKVSKSKHRKEITMQKVIKIEGMSCEHCRAKVTQALEAIKGVTAVNVDLAAKQAVITMTKEIKDKVFIKTVEKLGYTVSL